MKKFIFALLLLPMILHARAIRMWTMNDMMKLSEVAVLVEAVETKDSDDRLEIEGRDWHDYQGHTTTFRVVWKLKGEIKEDEIKILHFSYSKTMMGQFNGANFPRFQTKPVTLDMKQVEKEGLKPLGQITMAPPQYLCFLMRKDDGRYEPVTGQYDGQMSFCEVRDSRRPGIFWRE